MLLIKLAAIENLMKLIPLKYMYIHFKKVALLQQSYWCGNIHVSHWMWKRTFAMSKSLYVSAQCGYISKTENLLTLPIFIEKVDDSGKIMDRTVLYCMPIVVFFKWTQCKATFSCRTLDCISIVRFMYM